MTTRRSLLVATTLIASPALLRAQPASPPTPPPLPAGDPRMTERAAGRPDAPVTVQEWFSLTCSHCAHFAAETYPQIKSALIDTGKLRYVFKDYPLDEIALMAAAVARSLPPERYEPFVLTLFATQSRWAFDRSAEPREELAKMAALAGMPRSAFDKAVGDEALKAAILAEQQRGETAYHIDSTPTFVCGSRTHSGGDLDLGAFKKWAGIT